MTSPTARICVPSRSSSPRNFSNTHRENFKDGFADKYLAQLLGVAERQIRERRKALGEGWHPVPVSGVENAAYRLPHT